VGGGGGGGGGGVFVPDFPRPNKYALQTLGQHKRIISSVVLACSRRSDSRARSKKKASEREGKNEARAPLSEPLEQATVVEDRFAKIFMKGRC